MAKKKIVTEEATFESEKAKVGLVWTKENDDYYNVFFFFGDNKEALDDIRKQLNTNGDVWDNDEYPLIVKKIKKIHHRHFDPHKYFFFRTMHDNETDVRVEEADCQDLVDSVSNTQVALLHMNHDNQFAKAFAAMIIGGVTKKYDWEIREVITFTEVDKLGI